MKQHQTLHWAGGNINFNLLMNQLIGGYKPERKGVFHKAKQNPLCCWLSQKERGGRTRQSHKSSFAALELHSVLNRSTSSSSSKGFFIRRLYEHTVHRGRGSNIRWDQDRAERHRKYEPQPTFKGTENQWLWAKSTSLAFFRSEWLEAGNKMARGCFIA